MLQDADDGRYKLNFCREKISGRKKFAKRLVNVREKVGKKKVKECVDLVLERMVHDMMNDQDDLLRGVEKITAEIATLKIGLSSEGGRGGSRGGRPKIDPMGGTSSFKEWAENILATRNEIVLGEINPGRNRILQSRSKDGKRKRVAKKFEKGGWLKHDFDEGGKRGEGGQIKQPGVVNHVGHYVDPSNSTLEVLLEMPKHGHDSAGIYANNVMSGCRVVTDEKDLKRGVVEKSFPVDLMMTTVYSMNNEEKLCDDGNNELEILCDDNDMREASEGVVLNLMIEDCIVNANVAETGPARMGGKTLPEPTEEKGSTNPKCETGKIWIGSPDYEVGVEDGMRICDREGVVNDMKNGDCIATADTDTDTDIGTGIGTPALQAVMRL